ncbi:MAG: acyl-CoA dehydratase activase [Candidatus Acetothermia bacterium]
MLLGIDIGSITVKVALLAPEGRLLRSFYRRSRGKPISTVVQILEELFAKVDPGQVDALGTSGSGGRPVADLMEGQHFNELIAQAEVVSRKYPQVRSVIEIGGQDSKFLSLKPREKRLEIADFALNSQCSAGTGSFLDRQAQRLGLSIEKLSRLALKSNDPPRIAGRCSVFAESDIIHLQQVGTSPADIVNGLCYAVARNFVADVAQGKEIRPPVLFQGGVSRNRGMVRAFKDLLQLEEEKLLVPEHEVLMSAIGSAILAREGSTNSGIPWDSRRKALKQQAQSREEMGRRPPLKESTPERWSGTGLDSDGGFPRESAGPRSGVYLGVDVGSISTNLVAVDPSGNPLAQAYLKTEGEPISSLQQGLTQIREDVGDDCSVKGVGVTGSGREMISSLIGADLVKNEITAQATAAKSLDPEVDTIFEIGGQDSKYIRLKRGTVTDFSMNKACAAGTGSFLEEQARRLEVDISQFGEIGLTSNAAADLGERCTVFMESDLIHYQQQGAQKPELIAGLAYSIALNYLNRVVGDKQVGEKVYFQGGVAGNEAVVAAFRQLLEGSEVIVPEGHQVTGAYGAALLIKQRGERKGFEQSNFYGFHFSDRDYETSTFTCQDCSNRCEIKQVSLQGAKPSYYGSRCGKYDSSGPQKEVGGAGAQKSQPLPDLFSYRNNRFWGEEFQNLSPRSVKLFPSFTEHSQGRIGIPRALGFWDKFPFWSWFFRTLGYEVILSRETDRELIRRSSRNATSETCLPSKVAYGHIRNLLAYAKDGEDLDYLFLPALVSNDHPRSDTRTNYNCPLVQGMPYVANGEFDFDQSPYPLEVITRAFHFYSPDRLRGELKELGAKLGASGKRIEEACRAARKRQQQVRRDCRKRGREVLEELGPDQRGIVIMSRSYNGCDPELNMAVPQKLRELGVVPFPMQCLPLEEIDPGELHPKMQWDQGKRILGAASFINRRSHLYGVYLSHFRCGPDSFIIRYVKEILEEKPFLHLQLDEHSADAGIVTRCEAFLDSLRSWVGSDSRRKEDPLPVT